MINRDRLAALRKIEDERFLALHPKSGEMLIFDFTKGC